MFKLWGGDFEFLLAFFSYYCFNCSLGGQDLDFSAQALFWNAKTCDLRFKI